MKFTFIDLFAGIGGIRIALEEAGGKCVMTSEIDKFARATYESYFNDSEEHVHIPDITDAVPSAIPDHDILAGGFPCQPFSIAGVSKKNALGRKHGFEDPTKGTLFFNIKEILVEKRPKAFLLENVKNLRSHDKGRTWKVIQRSLSEAGFTFTDRVIDAASVVPQHRERVFIVGFCQEHFSIPAQLNFEPFWAEVESNLAARREEIRQMFNVPTSAPYPTVGAILEPTESVPERYVLTPNLWRYLQEYKAKHRAKGNGFGFGMVDSASPYTRTLSARYYKDGSEALVSRGKDAIPRRLTPLECARLQGFPEDFQRMYDRSTDGQPVSDTQAYKQFGNSVCVPVVSSIAEVIASFMSKPAQFHELPTARTQQALFAGTN